jgi:hypothetical protein
MDDKFNEHQELSTREQQLQARELELKLREMELDIYRQDAPLHSTVPERRGSNKPVRSFASFKQDLIKAAKFSGFALTGVAIIYISQWLAWISLFAFIGTAGWLWYKYRRQK